MYANIRIGDKDVGMLANAASSYIFKQIFHEDLLTKFSEMGTNLDQNIGEKLGYVFAMQAEKNSIQELMKLNMETFLEWASGFDPLDIFEVSDTIVDLYQKQKTGTSDPKGQGE